MNTTILYENGDTFLLTYRKSEKKEPNKTYANLGGVICEIISKEKQNSNTITNEHSLAVLKLDTITIQSLCSVPRLVEKLKGYSDRYSKDLMNILISYLEHKDFHRMSDNVRDLKSNDFKNFRNRWEFNTRALLLAVIYPD